MKNKLPNLNKRIIAAALSASLLGFSATSYSKSENNKAKNFVKEHPIVTSAAVMVGAGALIAGSIKLKEVVQTLQVRTPIYEIPDEKIRDYLNEQLDEFENYGKQEDKRWFNVNPEMLDEADPRVLALVVNTINTVFEKAPFLADVLKTKFSQYNSGLLITWHDGKQDTSFCRFCTTSIIVRNLPHSIEINKNYGCSLYKTKKFMKRDSLAVQKQVAIALGKFFDERCINPLDRLTTKRITERGRQGYPGFIKYEDKLLSRLDYNPYPFSSLLADYIFETCGNEDILMQIFKEHLDSLEKNWRSDKSMFSRY